MLKIVAVARYLLAGLETGPLEPDGQRQNLPLKGTDGNLCHPWQSKAGGSHGAPSGKEPVFWGQAVNVFALFTLSFRRADCRRLENSIQEEPHLLSCFKADRATLRTPRHNMARWSSKHILPKVLRKSFLGKWRSQWLSNSDIWKCWWSKTLFSLWLWST